MTMDQTSSATTRPHRGDQLTVTVDTLAFGGAGVARHEGYVVFVQGAIPGDTVRVEIGKAKRAYAEARVLEVVTPSPDRIEPVADHPGAPWQVIPYAKQLEIKAEQVDDSLRRIGKLDGYSLEPIIPAVQEWRYRNKLEYSFGKDGDDRLICGFHAPGRWEDIVEVTDCMLGSEKGNQAREEVVAWCRAQGLEPYDRRTNEGFLRNLVVREGRRTGEIQVRLVTSVAGGRAGRNWTKSRWRKPHPRPMVCCGPSSRASPRPPRAARRSCCRASRTTRSRSAACRSASRVRPSSRRTPRWPSASMRVAIEYAELKGYERLYDLYCGIGTIGLLMAPRVAELWGLEIVEDAIADAIANARRNEIDNAHFFAGDVRLAMRELVEKAGRPDVLVVDPPRAGLSQKVVRRIIEAAPKRIVYVSCNPTTLAPNAAQLVEAGYELTKVRPVDMFPQTPHIECVAQLERRSG